MSREEPNFQEMFQQNMNQLQSIQNDIGRKLTEKSEFSKQILPQLVDINKKLKNVRDKFNLLNQQLRNLEREITDKDKGIADAGTACAGLQNEIERLQQELTASQRDLAITKEKLNESNEGSQFANEDKQMEEMINALKRKEASLKFEIDSLKRFLSEQQTLMERLRDENEILKRQHFQLTQKISEIRKQIDDLNNADDKDPTPTQINELLKQITTILNDIDSNQPSSSEGGIFSSLFPPGLSSSSSSSSSASASQPKIPLDTQINIDGRSLTLETIMDQLTRKRNQLQNSNPRGINKYQNALDGIRNAINSNDVNQVNSTIPGILNDSSIKFNSSNVIIGGKRSRKTKKTKKIRRRRQKGGYQYNEKTKRRRFTTSVPNSSTSRTSRRTSSLNKDKSKTRKTL